MEMPPVDIASRREALLNYSNDRVIKRFIHKINVSHEDASNAFLAMKQFLYAASNFKEACVPSKYIDEMWHTFILFTKDYRDFCEFHFGFFIDHHPTDHNEENFARYILFRENAQSIFGSLNTLMWPDPSELHQQETEGLTAQSKSAQFKNEEQCNLKCNPKCNPTPVR